MSSSPENTRAGRVRDSEEQKMKKPERRKCGAMDQLIAPRQLRKLWIQKEELKGRKNLLKLKQWKLCLCILWFQLRQTLRLDNTELRFTFSLCLKARSRSLMELIEPLYISFHDEEWGNPVYDDTQVYELLALSQALAEMTWPAILNKRYTFRKLFDNFDPSSLAKKVALVNRK
ncbi:hypothetical protein K7X08_001844 [Anisodus acutangulus]|uniref:Uncharacterized protein n=1 Tax=Anisodus acutangulus TaxID=402998 RepID=A0A9Q1LSA2_9SOLA|nr:hypothetical protein K7X08_001844 [Anisodus acutangulus]